jgi:4-amino-4-deoxy-L-arabinose transferase-like glycosyltransferase
VPALLFLALPPLTASGMWDPYELNVADLARRVAVNLHHAPALALGNADDSLPHLNDLGRPQLPVSSMAIGFSLFGLHEWAGRLPMALWGLLGALATYAFVARLFDRRTGVYATVALATMPLYFVQARFMLGDVCTMAGLAMAFGGLAVAAFDRDERGPTAPARRMPWLAMGALGLFVGYESRGALLGLGVPLVAVGIAWAIARASARREASGAAVVGSAGGARAGAGDRVGDAVGALTLVAGAAITAFAVRAVAASEGSGAMSMAAGAILRRPSHYPTYDATLGAVGHALAPWSAFLPFAFGRLLLSPPRAAGPAAERESIARVAIVVGAAVALVAHGYLAARTEGIAFTAPALCAVACAVAIRDFERGAHASIAVGLGTLMLAGILHHDFHELPEKAYLAFGVTGPAFPESFKETALGLWWVVLGGFAVCALLTWVEQDAKRTPFDPKSYAAVIQTARRAWDGTLALMYVASVAGAALAALIVFAGARAHAQWLHGMALPVRGVVMNAWWVLALAPAAGVLGLLFVCDVWLWAFGASRPASARSWTRGLEPLRAAWGRLDAAPPPAEAGATLDAGPLEPWVTRLVLLPLLVVSLPLLLVMGLVGDVLRHRAPGLALGGAVVGVVLCVFYYPALADQLSPKEVFETYRRECGGAPLALLGVGGRTAAYYSGGQPQTLTDALGASRWLEAGGGERRCLAMKADDLPKLNSLWREKAPAPKENLPVLDARSSQLLLVSSSLGARAHNDNPLDRIVGSAPPHPQRALGVNLADQLEVVGLDLLDDHGRLVDAVSAGRPYRLKTYYRVLAHVATEWRPFLHVDGYNRRHNGDHTVLGGKYPMSLWLPGDVVTDDVELKLEPNFTPGTYTLWFGLAAGDGCNDRLAVKSGASDGCNRVNGGPLRVQ